MTSADLKDEVEPPFPFSSSGWLAVVLAAPSKPPVEAALKPPVKAPVEVVG